jgi:methylmalonyl-CoA epimerase
MKAVLDHIGIAVRDLSAALAFYRDGLGLEVEAPEEVASQGVRAHFIPVGESTLELLEATRPDSAIAKYVEKRGPGIHHVTLRVSDIRAALAQLKTKGIRLVDEDPRPGAEAALVAFIHPSSAHGVLVELKQPAPHPTAAARSLSLRTTRHTVGDVELVSLYDGYFGLDGGAMFGIVPKPLWSAKSAPDARNRIPLAMRPLLVNGPKRVIIDGGLGDKEAAKFHDIYAVDRARHLDHALEEAGLTAADIDVVLATHLHFDHAGGFTVRDASGQLRPRFPNARYVIRRGDWDDALSAGPRTRGSYVRDNFLPLLDAGVVDFIATDEEIVPGVRVERTGGHCAHHQMVWIESGGQAAAYVADLIPTTAHLGEAWGMGFDVDPVTTATQKQSLIARAIERAALIFFDHDPAVAAGYLTHTNGTTSLTPTP